jgi:glycopeptide antibiotics resistance protein
MPAINRSIKIVCRILFIVFILLLTKNILFKKSPGYYKNHFRSEYRNYTIKEGWKKANTTPFSTIKLFYNSRRMNPEFMMNNLLGNLLGFIPFGFLLPLLIPFFRNLFKTLVAGFLLSLGYETVQLVFGLGVFDVDDLLLNTAGVLIGFIIFTLSYFFFRIVKKENAIIPNRHVK